MSLPVAAKKLGISRQWLHSLVKEKLVKAELFETARSRGLYYISEKEVARISKKRLLDNGKVKRYKGKRKSKA